FDVYRESQKNKRKIPDLKDVNVEEALKILEDLDFKGVSVTPNLNPTYPIEPMNRVLKTVPEAGKNVDIGSVVKVYYIDDDVLEKKQNLIQARIQKD
ncbi:MAG: PASTA domain-containing protein, partial [Tissierellia bacterium]|nr:PASTA domain-containing protein [Tissierellia bacterium]